MGISDYRRPADYQVHHHYRCTRCGHEVEVESVYGGPEGCRCGGHMQFSGESYPASAEDWDEERDPHDGEWRRRW